MPVKPRRAVTACTRRGLLAGLGATLAGTPFAPRLAQATSGAAPLNIIWVVTPNGTVRDALWDPDKPGAGFEASGPLSEFAFGPILEPLARHRDRLLVARGINHLSAVRPPVPFAHWPDCSNLLTGHQARIVAGNLAEISRMSIDQHIRRSFEESQGFRMPSLHLGACCNLQDGSNRHSALSAVSATGPGAHNVIHPINSPEAVWEALFGGRLIEGPASDKRHARRLPVLELMREEIADVRCDVGRRARDQLDSHLEAIDDLERRLMPLTCDAGSIPSNVHWQAWDRFPDTIEEQMMNLELALRCRMGRVAVLQWARAGASMVHEWLGHERAHHELAHAPPETAHNSLIEIESWFSEKFAELLDRLAGIEVDDEGNSLLEYTVVVWCHEQARGNHERFDHCYVISAGRFTGLPMGRYVNFGGNEDNVDDHRLAHNRLLLSLAEAVGVSPAGWAGAPLDRAGPFEELMG